MRAIDFQDKVTIGNTTYTRVPFIKVAGNKRQIKKGERKRKRKLLRLDSIRKSNTYRRENVSRITRSESAFMGILTKARTKLPSLKYKFQKVWRSSNNGTRFYIIDFLVTQPRKVAFEVDGGYHTNASQIIYDQFRDSAMNRHGLQVVRFKNEEILKTPDLVLGVVVETLSNPIQ